MKRLELFEFEDFDWLPDAIRSGVTNLIMVLHRMMGTSKVISKLILDVKSKSNFSQIVDMGSGSGGPMLEVIKELAKDQKDAKLNLILTDRYPNPKVVKTINSRGLAQVQYQSKSLNATNIGQAPEGLKTMIASFHHMNPETAQKILLSAQENRQPILIYEIAKNTIPTLLWWLLLPVSLVILIVMTLFMTPFVRPLTLKQLVFTYVIPVIPLIYAWDGQASLMRTYTFKDVEHLLDDKRDESYTWEVGDAEKGDGKKMGYYILGHSKTKMA